MSDSDSRIDILKKRAEEIIAKKYVKPQHPNLTEEQILDILSAIPVPQTIEPETREIIWRRMIDIAYEPLKNKYVNPKSIPKLKRAIRYYFQSSFIVPGTPLGIASIADDIGAGALQSALDARKKPGSRQNAAGGIKIMKEVFQLSKRSTPITTVYFEKPQSFYDIMTFWRRKLVGITMSDLVKSYDIIRRGDIQPEWYMDYAEFRGENFTIPHEEYYVELTMNLNIMYAYRLDPEYIYNMIKDSDIFVLLYLPGVPTTMHLIPLKNVSFDEKSVSSDPLKSTSGPEVSDEDTETAEVVTIATDVTSSSMSINKIISKNILKFLNIHISGIPEITYIYPIGISVIDTINKEKLVDKENNIYELEVANKYIEKDGITHQIIADLGLVCGCTIISIYPLVIKVPGRDESAVKFIKARIADDIKDQKDYINERRKERYQGKSVSLIRPPTKIELKKNYYYIECSGATYSHFIDIDNIDMMRTYSNNVKEMHSYMGIEHSRSLLVTEIDLTYKNSGLNLESVTIHTAASKMTFQGYLIPYTYTGISYGKIGPLARSTLQRPLSVLQHAAINRETDNLTSVSSQIMVGKPISVGTGLCYTITENIEKYPIMEDTNNFSNIRQVCDKFD